MAIPLWQKLIGILIYILPWSDSIPFGASLFIEFPFLEWLIWPAYPIFILEATIPLANFILFFIIFLTLVRNPKVGYFIRFNALQAILLDITLILLSYAFQILLKPLGAPLLLNTLSNTVLIGMLAILIFCFYECLQGKEPDLPGISNAARMQL